MGARNYDPRPKPERSPKKQPKPLKRTTIKQRSEKKLKEIENNEGMLAFFVLEWTKRKSGSGFIEREYATVEEWREHTSQYRVCCVTYESLPLFMPGQMMHVLTKNYSRWKKESKNICCGKYEIHQIQEFGTRNQLIEAGPGGFWFAEYKEELKEEYHTK